MIEDQIAMAEASLRRLSGRLPNVPVSEVMLTRLILFLSHDVALMLDHHIRPFGLGEGEFRVLTALFSQPEFMAHPSDLCPRAFQSPANMSRICDALVNRELITRDLSAQDRRKMVLRITPKGEQLVRELLPSMHVAVRKVFSDFPGDAQAELVDQLKRLAIRLEDVMAQNTGERS